jgi:hypothetical protein
LKPLLLLDVDGVLCPISDRPPSPDYEKVGYLWVSPKNSDRVRSLQEGFEVHWATGWQHAANEIIAPIHMLPQFPVMPIRFATLDSPIHWKFSDIMRYVGKRPFAFVDDEIDIDGVKFAQARSHTIPTLFAPIPPQIGLTDAHTEVLKEWSRGIPSLR